MVATDSLLVKEGLRFLRVVFHLWLSFLVLVHCMRKKASGKRIVQTQNSFFKESSRESKALLQQRYTFPWCPCFFHSISRERDCGGHNHGGWKCGALRRQGLHVCLLLSKSHFSEKKNQYILNVR